MTTPSGTTLVFRNDETAGLEIVLSFALFAGREAAPAEIDRLGDTSSSGCPPWRSCAKGLA